MRHELAELRATQEACHEEMLMNISNTVAETLGITKHEAGELGRVSGRVMDVERDVRNHWDEFDAIRSLIRDVELDISSKLVELKGLVEKMRNDHASGHLQLERRCEELHEGLRGQVQVLREADLKLHEEVDRKLALQMTTLERKIESSLSQPADRHARPETLPRDLRHGDLDDRLVQLESSIASGLLDLKEEHLTDVRRLWVAIGAHRGPLASAGEQHLSIQDRLGFLENMLGDSAQLHSDVVRGSINCSVKELEAGHSSLIGRIGALEAALRETDARRNQDAEANLDQLSASRGTLDEIRARMEGFEGAVGRLQACEDFRKRFEGFEGDLARLKAFEELCSKLTDLTACQSKDLGALRDAVSIDLGALRDAVSITEAQHASAVEENSSRYAHLVKRMESVESDVEKNRACVLETMRERMDGVDLALRTTAEKHSNDLISLRAVHSKHSEDTQARHAELRELVAKERAARDERQASLEGALRESSERCDRALGVAKSEHAKFSGEAKGRDLRQTMVEERLAALESSMGLSKDEHTQGMTAAQSKLEQLHKRLAEERESRDQHQSFVHDQFLKERDERSANLASIVRRLDHFQGLLDSASQKNAAELQALKAAQAKTASEARAFDSWSGSLIERVESLERASNDLALQAAQTRAERLGHIESLINDHADRHSNELVVTEAIHSRAASSVQCLSEQHASLADRVDFLERTLRESLAMSSQEFRVAVSKLNKLQGRMSKVRAAWHREVEHVDLLGGSGGSWDTVPESVASELSMACHSQA